MKSLRFHLHISAALAVTGLYAAAGLSCQNGGRGIGESDRWQQDSAGIVVTTLAPGWQEQIAVWSVNPALLVIGGDAQKPGHDLFGVVGGVIFDNGIAVGDRGSAEIRFYDQHGELQHRSGGRGGGPAEFTSFSWFGVASDSTVIGIDLPSYSLVEFRTSGEFVRRRRIVEPFGELPAIIGVGHGDNVVLRSPRRERAMREDRPGERRDSVKFAITGPQEAHDQTVYYVALLGQEVLLQRNGPTWNTENVLFGRNALAAVGATKLFAGTNDRFRIEVRSLRGALERIIRADIPGVRVRKADVDRERQNYLNTIAVPRGAGPQITARLRDVREATVRALPTRSTFPAFSHLFADRMDRVWVRQYERPAAREATWYVFAANGRALGKVVLPADATLLDSTESHMLLLTRSAVGTEVVRLHEIVH